MAIEIVIDFDPKLAISTEEILSMSKVVVDRSSKNPVPICLHTIYLFPLGPHLRSSFRLGLMLIWQSSCTLQISGLVSLLGQSHPMCPILWHPKHWPFAMCLVHSSVDSLSISIVFESFVWVIGE